MEPKDQMLAAMAEIGAMRNLLVHAMALRMLEEPDPVATIQAIDRHLASKPTLPTQSETPLDPAMSDLLAALTDERTQAICADVVKRISDILCPAPQENAPYAE